MSKERAKKRAAREHEAGIKAAARGAEQERRERQKAKQTATGGTAPKSSGKGAARGPQPDVKKSPKQPHPRTPANKRGHAPVGRPDGPLARRRRFRLRLLLVLLLVVNAAAWLVWPDWAARLAVLILSVITAPLLAALLLRRR